MAKEFRNAVKRKQRLKKKARQLSTGHLMTVLALREGRDGVIKDEPKPTKAEKAKAA